MQLVTQNQTRDRILTLIDKGLTDEEIASTLRREGFRNRFGRTYSKMSVYWYRKDAAEKGLSAPQESVSVSPVQDVSDNLMAGIRSVLNLQGVPTDRKLKAIASLVS